MVSGCVISRPPLPCHQFRRLLTRWPTVSFPRTVMQAVGGMRKDGGASRWRGAGEVGMDAAEAVLSALDPEQREVALAARGPVCVLAGAGTGKTRAVAHRIAYAVAGGVVGPGLVLAVAFTTRAAGELRGRLRLLGCETMPGGGLEQVQARTFHAAALRQLTHFWPLTVGGPPPRVLDSKVSLVPDAAGEIEWAKVTGVGPEQYSQESRKAGRTPPLGPALLSGLYAAYEELR